MHMDPTVQHAPSKLVVHLLDQVKEWIKQIEEMGVIEKVSDPNDWVSIIVVAERPGKLHN